MIRLKPSLAWVCLALIVAMLAIRPAGESLVPAAVNDWAVISMAIWVQATPFLLLGVVVAGVITIYGFGGNFSMAASRIPLIEVPAAAGVGAMLPTCECAAVPTAKSLALSGLRPSAALSFMVAAPGANPIVIVSTLVAYTGREEMALARFVAAIATAVLIGLAWEKLGRGVGGPLDPLNAQPAANVEEAPKIGAVASAVSIGAFIAREFVGASALLALGASVAGAFKTLVPQDWVDAVGSNPVAGVAAMVALALILSLCSESDAFVAASMTSFSPVAQLAFMTVGPVIDIKLALLQGGTFGRAFLVRFVPIALVVSVISSVVVGLWILN